MFDFGFTVEDVEEATEFVLGDEFGYADLNTMAYDAAVRVFTDPATHASTPADTAKTLWDAYQSLRTYGFLATGD